MLCFYTIDMISRYAGIYDLKNVCASFNVSYCDIIEKWPVYSKAKSISTGITHDDLIALYEECPVSSYLHNYRMCNYVTKTAAGSIWHLSRPDLHTIPLLPNSPKPKQYLCLDDVVLKCLQKYGTYKHFIEHKNLVLKKCTERQIQKERELHEHQNKFNSVIDTLCREYSVSKESIERSNPEQYRNCRTLPHYPFGIMHVYARSIYMLNLLKSKHNITDSDACRIQKLKTFYNWTHDITPHIYTMSFSDRIYSESYANIIKNQVLVVRNYMV